MKLNQLANHWLSIKAKGYIQNDLDHSSFHRFDMGESVFGTDVSKLQFTPEMLYQVICDYADPSADRLKRKISKLFDVEINQISLGSGSDELIENIPRIFLNPSEKALIVTPTFFRFVDATQKVGGRIIQVKTSAQNNFLFDQEVCDEVINLANQEDVKIIWLCSPCNPTGQVIPFSFLEKICKSVTAIVVIDEAFFGFINPRKAKKNLSLIKQSNNVIILRSFSKFHGIPGLHIGLAISNPEICKVLETWRLPFNIPFHSQEAAIQLINENDESIKIRKKSQQETKRVVREMKKNKQLQVIGGSQTNVILVRHKKRDLFEELLKRKVLVADFRHALGIEGERFVRITIKDKNSNNFLLTLLKKIK